MVPLCRDIIDCHMQHPSLLDTERSHPETTPILVIPSLLSAQEQHDEDDTSISDGQVASLTTDDDDDDDDDDELLPDLPLPVETGHHPPPLSLRTYHPRLHREHIEKRSCARQQRLQETHRLGMLMRRMRHLEARNGQLKYKASTLQVQRDAAALQEQQDRERVRQLEEQLTALQQALAATR